ncbi:hypothetical protein [Legionella fallonii]|uniref:Uncharacterized protein n=1 Tax=Legionella fallonii LLAP-10 TaxID=1212491 RepID=A0A098G2B4_9GAMM|nr:hypothetical protein [Legionella fallonii]CEG55635.1 exported protein of unknown function [Legionella fallonii LLAP-10]
MKTSNKITGIIAYVLSSTTIAAASSSTLYEKLYRLTEKVYYSEYSFSLEQQQTIAALADQIEAVASYPNNTSCGNKLSVFQEAYKWSYSSQGLNLTSSEAEKFATDVSNKLCPATYFKTFQFSYNFAYKSDGMNKTKSSARSFATMISDYEAASFYTKNSVQCFIDGYNFAYSSDGMNKTRSGAEEYATKLCLG